MHFCRASACTSNAYSWYGSLSVDLSVRR